MNPFPVVAAMFRRQRLTLVLFVGLIAFAVALGVAITAQERALRQSSARAADKFDLLVGAPGSQYDLVLAGVYLRISSMELLPPGVFAELLADPEAEWVAPIAFGDSANGFPVVGTTAQFVTHLAGTLAEGEMFTDHAHAVVGIDVPLRIGEQFHTQHGNPGAESEAHEHDITVVGRIARTGSPWDRAVIVPVEQMWEAHGLPDGHGPIHDEEHAQAGEEDHAGDEHAHEDEAAIGPPFDPDYLPGVPAAVVKPVNLAAAYGLRTKYRTAQSQALFPAEVLVQLYALMGDARAIMQFLALATQALVVAAVLSGLMVIVQLYTGQLATLRALGATRGYVFLVTWTYFTALIAIGAILGVALGFGAAQAVSSYLASVTGFAIAPTFGYAELQLVAGLLGLGAILALIPGIALFRRPVIADLRQ